MTQVFYRHKKTGEVYCYDSEIQRDLFGPKDLVLMGGAEIDTHLNPPKVDLTREQIDRLRLLAYSNPITGSDRYYVESISAKDPEVSKKSAEMADARRHEIQAQYPWPNE